MRFDPIPLVLGAALVALGPAPAASQVGAGDPARAAAYLPLPPTTSTESRGQVTSPGIAIGTPTGFGADWGDIYLGVGVQSSTRYRDWMDAGVVGGFGLGNARRNVGLEAALTSYGTYRSCCRGGVSLKAHRVVGRLTGVAVGWENATGWGHVREEDDPFTDGGSSVYGVATHVVPLQRSAPHRVLALTAGIGNGRFRREEDVLAARERVNAFGSVALRFAEPASAIVSWTGQDLNAGISIAPGRRLPIVITPAFADLTTRPRFIVGVGVGVSALF